MFIQQRREACSRGSSCLRLWNHLPPPLPVPDPPPASLGDHISEREGNDTGLPFPVHPFLKHFDFRVKISTGCPK